MAADRSAVTYLEKTKQSAKGLLKTFQRFQGALQLAGTQVVYRPTLAEAQAVLNGRTLTQGTPITAAEVGVIVDGRPRNIGITQTSGFDVDKSYRFNITDDSTMKVGMTGIVFTQYKDKPTVGSTYTNHLNDIFFAPRFRARFYADWQSGPFNVKATGITRAPAGSTSSRRARGSAPPGQGRRSTRPPSFATALSRDPDPRSAAP